MENKSRVAANCTIRVLDSSREYIYQSDEGEMSTITQEREATWAGGEKLHNEIRCTLAPIRLAYMIV